MDLIIGNGTVTTLPLNRPDPPTTVSATVTASPSLKIQNLQAKIRTLERDLAEAQEAKAAFETQQKLDIALQALSDLNMSTAADSDGEEDLLLPSQEMRLFEASKLKLATEAKEEEELSKSLNKLGLKDKRKWKKKKRNGGIDKAKRYKGPENLKETEAKLNRAVRAAAAVGLEGEGKRAGEMFVPGVGIVMGKKTVARLTDWKMSQSR